MEILKIKIHSTGYRLLNLFVYSQVAAEPGAVLSPDGVNLPKITLEESERVDKKITTAAAKGIAANSFKVYRQNLE